MNAENDHLLERIYIVEKNLLLQYKYYMHMYWKLQRSIHAVVYLNYQ